MALPFGRNLRSSQLGKFIQLWLKKSEQTKEITLSNLAFCNLQCHASEAPKEEEAEHCKQRENFRSTSTFLTLCTCALSRPLHVNLSFA